MPFGSLNPTEEKESRSKGSRNKWESSFATDHNFDGSGARRNLITPCLTHVDDLVLAMAVKRAALDLVVVNPVESAVHAVISYSQTKRMDTNRNSVWIFRAMFCTDLQNQKLLSWMIL